jgi:hypothetical protein
MSGAYHPKVLPHWAYRDPADTVKLACETSCKGCHNEVHVMGSVHCLIARTHSSRGGKKCKRFKNQEAA